MDETTVVTAGEAPAGIEVAGIDAGTAGAAKSEPAQRTCNVRDQHTPPAHGYKQRIKYEKRRKNQCQEIRGEKTNLADVDVGAVCVDLRVVRVEHRRVDAVVLHNLLTGVTAPDDVSGGAVLAFPAEAEFLADLEVVARRVNAGVHNGELVAVGWGQT